MPKKRPGQTQKSIQIPDLLLAAIDAKRGETSLNAYLCELASRDTGAAYEPNPVGAPSGNRNATKKTKSAAKKPAGKK